MSPRLLRIDEVADALGASRTHVYDLIAAGALRVVDIASPGARRSKTRIRDDDLAAYIDANTRSAKRLRSAPR